MSEQPQQEEIVSQLSSLEEHEGWKYIKKILQNNVDFLKDVLEDKNDDEKFKIKNMHDYKVITSRLNDRQKLLELPTRIIEGIRMGKGIDQKEFDAYEQVEFEKEEE